MSEPFRAHELFVIQEQHNHEWRDVVDCAEHAQAYRVMAAFRQDVDLPLRVVRREVRYFKTEAP